MGECGVPCICLPVPRVATLDGRDGWRHVVDDCQHHGRDHFGSRPAVGGEGE